MARVFLLSATPPDDSTSDHLSVFHGLQASAARDRFGVHQLTEDPEAADVILFAETYGAGWHFERVRQHPFTRKFREKCFIYCENPYVIPFLPGVYTGIDRRWASRRTVGGFYLKVSAHDTAPFVPPDPSLPYLFSFMGSIQTASVRQALPSLEHPRGFFRETSVDFQAGAAGRDGTGGTSGVSAALHRRDAAEQVCALSARLKRVQYSPLRNAATRAGAGNSFGWMGGTARPGLEGIFAAHSGAAGPRGAAYLGGTGG